MKKPKIVIEIEADEDSTTDTLLAFIDRMQDEFHTDAMHCGGDPWNVKIVKQEN